MPGGDILLRGVNMIRKKLFTSFIAAVPPLLTPTGARACSVCGLDDLSYMWSYLFMTGVPIAAMGVIGGYLFYSYRGNNKSTDAPSGPSANSS